MPGSEKQLSGFSAQSLIRQPTSYMSRIASIAKAAFKENNDISDEIAYLSHRIFRQGTRWPQH